MTAMLIRVLTAGGGLADATVRAAAHHASRADHIEVRLLLDVRWLEPLNADPEFFATPFTPEEEDPATQTFFQEMDEQLEVYREICSESAATFTAIRVLGMPDEAVSRAARSADLLVLPHPTGASAELRKAIQAAVAAPPVPLLLVAHSETAQAATVESEGEARGLNGAHVLLGSLLGGKVRRIAVDAGTPAEPFRSLAPLVVETSNGSALTDDEVDPEEVYVLLNASRAKGFLGSRALARRRLSPQRNLLLVPDHRK